MKTLLRPRLSKAISSLKKQWLLLVHRRHGASRFVFLFLFVSFAVWAFGILLAVFHQSEDIDNWHSKAVAITPGRSLSHPENTSRLHQIIARAKPNATSPNSENITSDIVGKLQLEGAQSPNVSQLVGKKSYHQRGVLMSCPVGQSQTHRGAWKPRKMILGVEAVIKQLESFKSDLPLLFGYYDTELMSAEQWCRNVSRSYENSVEVLCFQVSMATNAASRN